MFCPKCGNEVGINDAFCRTCGNNLNVELKEANTLNTQPVEMPVINKKNRYISIALIACGVLIILLSISTILGQYNDSNDDYNYSSGSSFDSNYGISCHSTSDHKNALYYYDFDNNKVISKYEMEAFLDAHPNVIYDTGFMNWAENNVA